MVHRIISLQQSEWNFNKTLNIIREIAVNFRNNLENISLELFLLRIVYCQNFKFFGIFLRYRSHRFVGHLLYEMYLDYSVESKIVLTESNSNRIYVYIYIIRL